MRRFFNGPIRILKSKSIMGSILFAIALWVYISLRIDYTTKVKVPLMVILPENKAIDSTLASSITVEVRGSGWKLFNLLFFDKSSVCLLDLSDQIVTDFNVEIPRNEILKNLQISGNVQAMNIIPDRLVLKMMNVGENKVPVKPQLKIVPVEEFTVVGAYRLSPDSVLIKGNERIVKNITFWPTKFIELNHINKPFSIIAPLSDSLKGMINLADPLTKIDIEVQQKSAITIPNVDVLIRGGKLSSDEHLYPESVNITIEGGIDKIVNLNIENIKASVDYNDLITDSTGIIIPHVSSPENIKILRVDPPYIYYMKRLKKNL
jgi:hypothetical protein